MTSVIRRLWKIAGRRDPEQHSLRPVETADPVAEAQTVPGSAMAQTDAAREPAPAQPVAEPVWDGHWASMKYL